MRRGELWSAATGSGFGGKPRPVLVVQADAFSAAPNILVALLTTTIDDHQRVRPLIEPDSANNLDAPSLVQVDILVTVPRRKFGMPIGRISPQDQARVDQALLAFLGFTA